MVTIFPQVELWEPFPKGLNGKLGVTKYLLTGMILHLVVHWDAKPLRPKKVNELISKK